MPEQLIVTLSLVEVSRTDYLIVKVALSLLEKSGIKMNLLEKGDSYGQIIVVDVDTQTGRDFYVRFIPSPKQSLLILSTETFNDRRYLSLKKPVRVQALRDMLHDMSTRLLAKLKEVSTQVDKNQPVTQTHFDSTHALFFVLLRLRQEPQQAQIVCANYAPLFVDTARELVATNLTREVLRKLVRERAPVRSTKLTVSEFDTFIKGQTVLLPLKTLLWNAGVYGSHGHLIRGHSAEIPVQLKAWPNLSRLDFDFEHLKLATLMTSEALTLKQIAEKIPLPWATIVGFYNAAWASDLIVIKPTNLPKAQHTKTPPKLGLLARIAQRLKLASF